MSALNPSRQLSRVVITLGCLFSLCSCVATPPKTHFLEIAQNQKIPVTIQVPMNWILSADPTQPTLTLQRTMTKEHISITAKKLGVDKVDLKLLKVFGRINVKDWLTDGWAQQRYHDDVIFDGNQATQYVLRKDGEAAIIYHIGKAQYAYIVSITAPADIIATTDQTLRQSVHLSEQGDVTTTKFINSSQDTYIPQDSPPPHPNILNLSLSGYNLAEKSYLQDLSKALSVNERLILLEQICFKYTLLKSESFFYKTGKTIDSIFMDIEQIATGKNTHPGLARCEALVDYLDNRFPEAINQLEKIIKKNPNDIEAKLYLSIIRPYQTSFIKKTIKEIEDSGENNLFTTYIQSKIYLAEGKERESKDLLKTTLKKNQKNLWITFAVARNYQADDDSKNAVLLYTKVLQMDTTFAPAMYNLALINYKNTKIDLAQKYLTSLLSLHPDDPEALLLQGQLHKKRNESLAAKKNFESVLVVDPGNYRALYNLGALCATKLNDTDCARMAFSRYISIAPTNNRHASIISWLKKN